MTKQQFLGGILTLGLIGFVAANLLNGDWLRAAATVFGLLLLKN